MTTPEDDGTFRAALIAIHEEEAKLTVAAMQNEFQDGFIPLPEYITRMYAVREARRRLIRAAEAARHYCSIRPVPLAPEARSGQKQSGAEVLL
jgi:hypothetical protein